MKIFQNVATFMYQQLVYGLSIRKIFNDIVPVKWLAKSCHTNGI